MPREFKSVLEPKMVMLVNSAGVVGKVANARLAVYLTRRNEPDKAYGLSSAHGITPGNEFEVVIKRGSSW